MQKELSFVFFGTGALAESVLASLVRNGYTPSLIVTKPDSPQGRHMQMTSPHIKTWADIKGIPVLQPEKLDNDFYKKLSINDYQLFIVASYGKIIPEDVLNIPKHGALNVHPSLLPLYRGASPIESSLLDGNKITGITIIKLDKEMDHGPIIVQNAFDIPFESTSGTLEVLCGQMGGDILSQIIPSYVDGTLIPKEQEHSKATFCKKIEKNFGEIKLTDKAEDVRKKFRALTPWPGIYFFIEHKDKRIRVKITGINLALPVEEKDTAKDIITSVIPEGKKEMDWDSFLRGHKII